MWSFTLVLFDFMYREHRHIHLKVFHIPRYQSQCRNSHAFTALYTKLYLLTYKPTY